MSSTWSRLLRPAAGERRATLGLLGLMALAVGFEALKPWPLKILIDHVLSGQPIPVAAIWSHLPGFGSTPGTIAWAAFLTLAIFIAAQICLAIRNYVQTGLGSRLQYALAAETLASIEAKGTSNGRYSTGDLIKRITADTSCVRQMVVDIAVPAASSLLTLGVMFGILWTLNFVLALLALVVAVPLGVLIRHFAEPLEERTSERHRVEGEMLGLAEQALTAVPLVQTSNRLEEEDRRFRSLSRRALRASIRTTNSELQFSIGTGTVTAIGTALVMTIGALQVLDGQLTPGELVVVLSYLAALYAPLEALAYLSVSAAGAKAGARRVFEVLDQPDPVPEPTAPVAFRPPHAGAAAWLELRDVAYGYQPGRPVLQGVDLSVGPDECVAVVGPNGSGKSTLLSLVPRLADPWQGRVTIGGIDVRRLRRADVRGAVAVVLQEALVLPLTVAENIAYGRPGAGREDIVAAARAAQAHRFIERLPAGYDTVVGERGVTLSGGERQRIAMARAFLKDAPILLLDEPTSALDADTEAELLAALRGLCAGRATLLVSHRTSTLSLATRAVRLIEGTLAEAPLSRAIGLRAGAEPAGHP